MLPNIAVSPNVIDDQDGLNGLLTKGNKPITKKTTAPISKPPKKLNKKCFLDNKFRNILPIQNNQSESKSKDKILL